MEDFEKKIIKSIHYLSDEYSAHQIFNDWVAMTALTISNSVHFFHDKTWKDREKQYMTIANKYSDEKMKIFAEMSGSLTMLLSQYGDALGSIYMKGGCGNKNTGQFFTPYSVSYATAKLSVPNDVSEDNPLLFNEPSSGGGGMIIAAANVIFDRGLNPQRCLKIVAQDLDWTGVYMTYVQLSLLGLDAVVVQGNTLKSPHYVFEEVSPNRIFRTPRNMGVFL